MVAAASSARCSPVAYANSSRNASRAVAACSQVTSKAETGLRTVCSTYCHRARERAADGVEHDGRRDRQAGKGIYAQVLLADQPRAHRVEDPPRSVAAAFR